MRDQYPTRPLHLHDTDPLDCPTTGLYSPSNVSDDEPYRSRGAIEGSYHDETQRKRAGGRFSAAGSQLTGVGGRFIAVDWSTVPRHGVGLDLTFAVWVSNSPWSL